MLIIPAAMTTGRQFQFVNYQMKQVNARENLRTVRAHVMRDYLWKKGILDCKTIDEPRPVRRMKAAHKASHSDVLNTTKQLSLRQAQHRSRRSHPLSSSPKPSSASVSVIISTDDHGLCVSDQSDRPGTRNSRRYTPSLASSPTSETLFPGIRMLFDHFARVIAPYMVVLDSSSNGWRDMILPIACQEPLVQRAVSVVSAFHFSSYRPELCQYAEAGRNDVIARL